MNKSSVMVASISAAACLLVWGIVTSIVSSAKPAKSSTGEYAICFVCNGRAPSDNYYCATMVLRARSEAEASALFYANPPGPSCVAVRIGEN